MKLLEAISKDYIEDIYKQVLVWLKNIKRIETVEQYKELNKRWVKWLNEYLDIQLGKNLFGKNTVNSLQNSDLINLKNWYNEYEEFLEYVKTIFMPTTLDVTRYIKAGNSWSVISYKEVAKFLLAMCEGDTSSSEDSVWQLAFYVYDPLRQSKYIGTKKKIDEYFNGLINTFNNDLKADERYITDSIKIEGVTVFIDYKETDFDFIKKAVSDTKDAFRYIIDSGFKKALQNTSITLSTTDIASKSSNVKDGKDYGTGGFYTIADNKSTILKNNINTYNKYTTITTIIHESGHKFYYDILSNNQRKEWENFYGLMQSGSLPYNKAIEEIFNTFNDDYMELRSLQNNNKKDFGKFETVPKYANWLNKYISDNFEDIQRMAYNNGTNLVTAINEIGKIVNKLNKEKDCISLNQQHIITDSFMELLDQLKDKDMKASKYKMLVTEYGTTTASEFFAETFTGYCLWSTEYGRKNYSLIQSVFEKFIDITGVRSAYRESLMKKENSLQESFKKLGHIEWSEPYMNSTISYEGMAYSDGKFTIRVSVNRSNKKQLELLIDDKIIFTTQNYLRVNVAQAIELIEEHLIPLITQFDSYKEIEKTIKTDKEYADIVQQEVRELKRILE